jgi:hypothetical protein
MQAQEQGLIDIDKPISLYVDKILYRLNRTRMADLWPGDPRVHNITARRLMSMRAGLHDYDDEWYHNVTLTEPDYSVSPFELLHRFNKTWIADPGQKEYYSSVGYELLGLALAQVHGSADCSPVYSCFDQMSVIPSSLRPQFNDTTFPGPGRCSEDPKIVHQYANTPYKFKPITPGAGVSTMNYTFYDILNTSCLNGWTW